MGYLLPMTPIQQSPASGAPPLTGHEPLFIVLNTGSGRGDAQALQDIIRRVLDEAGRRFQLMPVDDPSRLVATAREAVALAREAGGIVVAAGGDGTLNAVAGQVLGQGVPFGILPQGTFNYFGRRYGISQDTEAALRGLLGGELRPVQVGLLNGRLFLVNASLGLYPQLLEDREAYKQRFGRSRLVALWSGLVTLMRAPRQLSLRLDYEGRVRDLRSPTLVVGNNRLQLEHIGIDPAELDRGHLVAMAARPVGTLALYGLLLRGLFSRLGEAEHVVSFAFDRLMVSIRGRRRVKVAMDGEISWMDTPLEFKVSDTPLPLVVPVAAPEEGRP
ncbi:Diacylglycerol kinase [Achromobacter xylosoxidans]|uniref:diacylglycerol/lipid kinase family protein n=3 Tax=Alcaligenaceae TaxID=506 RepID=UPI0001F43239|nr:diacylglycerol kinase family protein [Achromobacter xylosoxidans]AHC45832.1 Transcription regulator [Achromobacter xylosoxidans NBRC 15126 = ATCC 27061]EFV82616.1 diacylglycerol kinase [Achromobacter xylosoxidans C54]MCH4584801.1 diacylglycerol kinase [Achromobacter xylosoxidans]WPQ34476.1 diacylglycerol kinase family protein [Achromobacter xylosoxidans]CCH04603.1 Transcription regulator [contains diacylglycerol kinase catalytic domain] [Achromobacter xylosoxidans NH44784-1996]